MGLPTLTLMALLGKCKTYNHGVILYNSGTYRPNSNGINNMVTSENDQPTVISNNEAIDATEDAVRLCNHDNINNL